MNNLIKSKQYIHYFSFLRVIAMIAVIGIHTIANTIGNYYIFLNDTQIFIGVSLKAALLTWAVPIFIMISGALFLDNSKEITISKMFSKYILRLLLVLITFGTLFALMELIFYEHSISFKLFLISLKNVYEGKSWDHLWFIYMLIGIYIVTPLLRILICNANATEIKYFLLVLFLFTCCIPFLNFLTKTKFGVWIPGSSIYILYYVIGYALHNDIIKIPSPLALSLLSIGLLWCFLGQLIPNMLTLTDTGFQFELTSQDSITGFIISISIFSLANKNCSNSVNWIDTKIAPLSFGVYIIHMVFMNILFKVFHFTPEYHNTYLVWIIVFTVTLFSSLLTTFFLRKISFIRKWLL